MQQANAVFAAAAAVVAGALSAAAAAAVIDLVLIVLAASIAFRFFLNKLTAYLSANSDLRLLVTRAAFFISLTNFFQVFLSSAHPCSSSHSASAVSINKSPTSGLP